MGLLHTRQHRQRRLHSIAMRHGLAPANFGQEPEHSTLLLKQQVIHLTEYILSIKPGKRLLPRKHKGPGPEMQTRASNTRYGMPAALADSTFHSFEGQQPVSVS